MTISNNISLKKLIAQCIISRLEISKYRNDLEYNYYIKSLIDTGIGGFCIFNGSSIETKLVINELQTYSEGTDTGSEIPLFFAADFENGLPMRLTDGTSFPHAMAFGKSGNPDYTYYASKAIAKECKWIGVNWNFAPVCDINSNSENPIINIRAYGEMKDDVIPHIKRFIKGLQEEKILACAKHFPGHGDTAFDSHLQLPVLNKSYNNLKNNDLIPFVESIKSEVRSIMVGHLSIPQIDNSGLPASLSKKIVNDLLINELNFDGLIITDALEMKAITNLFSMNYACEAAINAGVNILLMPDNIENTIYYLENISKISSNILKLIEISFDKILKAKEWCGPFKVKESNSKETYNKFPESFQNNEKLALEIAYSGIKLTGDSNLIPIKEKIQIAGFAVIQDENIDNATQFFRLTAQAIENDCDFAFIDLNITNEDITKLRVRIIDAKLLIFAFFFKAKAYLGNAGISDKITDIIKKLSAERPTIAILFGSPYIADKIPANLYIHTFSDSLSSIAAAVLYICGRKPV